MTISPEAKEAARLESNITREKERGQIGGLPTQGHYVQLAIDNAIEDKVNHWWMPLV